MELIIKKYSELTDTEKEQVYSLILKGHEVNPQTLPARLSETALIAFFNDKNKVVATAAIKKPLESYKKSVFAKSKSNLSPDDNYFELGYVMVTKFYRGKKLASQLCEELSKKFLSDKLFATTRTDNSSMQTILQKNQFIEVGEKYLSRDSKTFLKLFVKKETVN
jgi:predicted GNAT family N-acyltransferase